MGEGGATVHLMGGVGEVTDVSLGKQAIGDRSVVSPASPLRPVVAMQL